jgi:hypothetical protein
MDKTLETVTLVHRLILGVALGLFLVGVSIQHPNSVYDQAELEIQTLTDNIEAVSEQVDEGYKSIYEKSEIKSATLAWLRQRNGKQKDLDIEVISPADLAVPDSTRDPLLTLDTQVKWANRIYRDLNFPFLLCDVSRPRLIHALDNLFSTSSTPTFSQLRIYLRDSMPGVTSNRQFSCEIELEYEVRTGSVMGVRNAILQVPTNVVEVTQIAPPGPDSIDLEIEHAFKENGLGDFEDTRAVLVPSLWDLWTDVGGRSPAAATAFLEQKKKEEVEKSKEKIEILGESLDRSVTIIATSTVELCLMIYLLAHLIQVGHMLPEHEATVAESPFYGIMCTRLGQLVILSTLVAPFAVCAFVLVGVFPSIKAEWPGPHWIVSWEARWLLIAFLSVTDWLLISQARSTVALLERWRKPSASGLDAEIS